ncbi:hypothetical protein ABES36_14895 [Bacillus pseudomycoides]|uniref:hypothetical protein n=1 Tax=Bacillus pseudomycoides TaxID=64104 RepID=UPI003D2349BA
MTNQLEMFLNSSVGKRLMKIAEKEQAEFDNAIAEKRNRLGWLKENINLATYGMHRDVNKFILVEGVPTRMITNGTSHITHIETVTPESFKQMNGYEMDAIKKLSSVAYQKLKHGKEIEPNSDHFYRLMGKAEEGICADLFDSLINAPTDETHPGKTWEYYHNGKDMTDMIPKRAYELMENRSEKNIVALHTEARELEQHIEECMESQSIVPFSQGGGVSE